MPPPSDPTASALPPASVGDLPTAAGDLPPDDLTASRPTTGGPAAPASVDPPPGFAIERELGVGGMGAVYLARQTGLNRSVALKLVRAGEKADQKALIRFLAEAEAVASVRHPNVVEVYAYGDHQGKPYMALEFCGGGDLTATTATTPTRDAGWYRRVADLMAGVAAGVQAAHAAGIVHRDLKPGNVLLASNGVPKVADFGLAKRGVGSDLTRTHAVMGTPAYMSPEQAGGGGKFVGPEADVWALGVMLYELGCGERPFDGGNVMEVLAAVAAANVPPLKSKSPTVPPDLALIAHKCLQKEPKDRYPTAGGLAADLRNWLDGKPISARPAGAVEQAVKWAKRNKTLAGMGLAVLLTMAAATGVSVGFGLDATAQRQKAEDAARRADDKAAEAERSNEQTERTLANALLAPISTGEYDAIGVYEHNALWQLATLRGGRVPSLLLTEATATPLAAAQLRNRGAYLDHAAVGLDSRSRASADALYLARLRDPNTPDELKRNLARLAAGTDTLVGTPELSELLLANLSRSTRDGERFDLANAIARQADRLPPPAAVELCEKTVGILTAPYQAAGDADPTWLATSLLNASKFLPPEREAAVVSAAHAAGGELTRGILADGLVTAAHRLPPDRGAEVLLAALRRAKVALDWGRLGVGLAEVAARLPPERAAAVCEEAVAVMLPPLKAAPADSTSTAIPEGVAALTAHLPPDRAATLCRPAVARLLDSMSDPKRTAQDDQATGFGWLATRLPPDEAATALLTALERSAMRYEWKPLLEGLAKVLPELPAKRAVEVYDQAARLALAGLATEADWVEVSNLANGLSALEGKRPAGRDFATVRTATGRVVEVLLKSNDSSPNVYICMSLAAVTEQLPAGEAAEACGRVADHALAGLRADPTSGDRYGVARALEAVTVRMPADRGADVIAAALAVPGRNYGRSDLAGAIMNAAERLPADDAAGRLLALIDRAATAAERGELAFVLGKVVRRLPPERVGPVCQAAADKLLFQYDRVDDWTDRWSVCKGLTALAARVPPQQGYEWVFAALDRCASESEVLVLSEALNGICSGLPPPHYLRRRHPEPFAAVYGIAAIHPATMPTPRPLPPQQLVDLLKHPFCVEEARRAVLDALEITYDRKFAHLWEFVAFAEKEHPELDLLTPPKRPERK